jgi:hypothetical protein
MLVKILRIEGLSVFLLSSTIYFVVGFNWLFFVVLFFTPDIFMLGYFKNNVFGAIVYNLGHTYTIPIGLGLIGLLGGFQTILAISLIWLAHIGLDRVLGFGLKQPTDFKDTDLGRLGKIL